MPVQQGREGVDWAAVMAKLEAMGELVAEASPGLQKEAINAMFQRIEVDLSTREVVSVRPRVWCRPFF